MEHRPDPPWSVVIPVKRLVGAKSRLADPGADRAELALAFARDTVAAALACPRVSLVVVVTDDDQVAAVLGGAGALVVPDGTDVTDVGSRLNRALLRGAAVAGTRSPGGPVAALTADLPCLRADDLTAALDEAGHHILAFTPDAEGTGTTLFAATAQEAFRPAYGVDSAAAHRAAGAVEVGVSRARLRRDVDTAADLVAALALDVGPYTAHAARMPDANT